jgi:serine/threonine protein phosphatase PrpC
MFSDGICDGADDAPGLVELLNRSGGGDLKGLAEAILAAAKEHAAYKDDMTVVVSKVGSV